MPTKRTRTNGISRQTAQNILAIARLKNVKISALETALDMKSSALSRIARDNPGHRLYAQDLVLAARFLHVSADDIINWHESTYSPERFRIKGFLSKAADDTRKGKLEWNSDSSTPDGTIYRANIGGPVLCVNTKGAAWIEDGHAAYIVTNAGDQNTISLLSVITKPIDISDTAAAIIDRFMA